MRRIAVTSEKGGVGKSTLAFNLAGALAERGRVVLIDEDTRIQSCLQWATLSPVPFTVVSPEQAGNVAASADFLVIDSEGRPSLSNLVELASSVDVLLIPCGTSRLELQSALSLWRSLEVGGHTDAVHLVITRALPHAHAGGEARDALRSAGVRVLETVVRRYAAHERAAELGGLVRDVRDPRAVDAWSDILGVAAEVAG